MAKKFGNIKIDGRLIWGAVGAATWILGLIADYKKGSYDAEDITEEAATRAAKKIMDNLSSEDN